VSISPLVQIADKTVLHISHRHGNATQQLLSNYCYGHRKSSLLLCPTTHAAMINHDSNRANIAIRWVRKGGRNQDVTVGPLQGLDVNREDLASYNTRLQLEYVALRDISEGDELFLDYGKEWEDALSDHIEHGTSSAENESGYISATLMSKLPVMDSEGQEASIEDRTYIYECRLHPNVAMDSDPVFEDIESTQPLDLRNWPSEFLAWYKENDFASWYPCKVVSGDSVAKRYSVEVFVKPLTTQSIGRKYSNVPGERIRISDGLYQSDQHLPWSFRHYIPMPDSMFPLRWRDDYRNSSSMNLGKLDEGVWTAAVAEDYERSLRKAKCGLYLAKSNIPNAGRYCVC
jgi:SET domain